MNFSINHLTKEISISAFENFVFCERLGIEIILKINRIIYEFLNLNNIIEPITIKLDYYNDEKYLANLSVNGIVFECKYGSISIDVSEVRNVRTEICNFLNINYGLSIIDFSKMDPMFLEQMLGIDIPYLNKVEIKEVRLLELRNFSKDDICGRSLHDGRYYKQIVSRDFVNIPVHKNNFVWQTNEQRIKSSIDNMLNNQYSLNGSYIVLYNDSYVIRDGEHRASALLYLYGNILIPVMVLGFSKNYYSYKLFYEGSK